MVPSFASPTRTKDKVGSAAEIARVPDAAAYLAGEVRLRVADLDNNGALDLLLSSTSQVPGKNPGGALIWLGDEQDNLSC